MLWTKNLRHFGLRSPRPACYPLLTNCDYPFLLKKLRLNSFPVVANEKQSAVRSFDHDRNSKQENEQPTDSVMTIICRRLSAAFSLD